MTPARPTRVVCYCRDCQAYAHALGNPGAALDALGGTHIVAALQQHVAFTNGADSLACLSPTERGLRRWYASCCNTPIANTVRNPKLSHVGLVHTCLAKSPASLEADYGPARAQVNTSNAGARVSIRFGGSGNGQRATRGIQ